MLMKKTIETKEIPEAPDPWPSSSYNNPSRVSSDDPSAAPAGWHRLSEASRMAITGTVLALLAENPERRRPADVAWLAARAWGRVRTVPIVSDELQQTGFPAPTVPIGEVVRKLMNRDELVAGMRARADELARAIAALERVAPR